MVAFHRRRGARLNFTLSIYCTLLRLGWRRNVGHKKYKMQPLKFAVYRDEGGYRKRVQIAAANMDMDFISVGTIE